MSTSAPSSSVTILASELKLNHSYQLADRSHIRFGIEDNLQRLERPHKLLEITYHKPTNSYSLLFQTDGKGEFPKNNIRIFVFAKQEFLEPSSAPAPTKGGKRKSRRNKRKSRKQKRKTRKH